MKLHITETDLLEISEQQKEKLRYIWIPKERDTAVAFVCSNAESEELETIVFTIGKVECDLNEIRGNRSKTNKFSMVLRSLRLVDDSFYEGLTEDADIEALELEYQTPIDYFSLEYCLPLLNIGQMIEILEKHYFLSYSDISIKYNNEDNIYRIGRRVLLNNDENFEFESKELCDALWEAVKSIL